MKEIRALRSDWQPIRPKKHQFENRDGRKFYGTYRELAAHTAEELSTIQSLFRGTVTRSGWFRADLLENGALLSGQLDTLLKTEFRRLKAIQKREGIASGVLTTAGTVRKRRPERRKRVARRKARARKGVQAHNAKLRERQI